MLTFNLETLGGLALRDPKGTPVPVQRRRLALLARLSATGDRGLTREKLGGSLWGESSQERARHALEQSLYSLRRQLSPEVFLGSDPLRVNPDVISSDVQDFERAIAAGSFDHARSLYRGPFLDGVFIDDADEFEQWADAERERLRRAYISALERIARMAEARSDYAAAIEAWRSQAIADPLSEVAAVGLVRSLAAAGDTTVALQVAQEFDQRIREELQGTPGQAIAELVRDIRTGRIRPATRSVPELPALGDAASITAREEPKTASPDVVPEASPRTRPPSPKSFVVVAALLLAATLGVGLTWRSRGTPRVTADRIAVLPARVVGTDSSTTRFAEGVADLLAIALDGNGVPSAADPRATAAAWERMSPSRDGSLSGDGSLAVARALGANAALLTDVVKTDANQLRVTARIISAKDGAPLARAEFIGTGENTSDVAHRLLAELLARQAGEEYQRLASLTSASLPAVVEFLQGRAERRRGHVSRALQHFARAFERDTTFALAALEYASTTGWLLRWTTRSADTVDETIGLGTTTRGPRTARDNDQWNRAMAVAWRERDRLNARDRALLQALRGPRFPGASYASEILRAWDDAIRTAPDRAAGYFSIGYLLLFQGDAIGLADARQRARAAFNRSLELDSAFAGPLVGLLEIAAFDRSIDDARRIAELYLSRDSLGAQADYVRWRVASLTGDHRALARLRSRFETLDAATLAQIERTSQVDGIAIEDADRASEAVARRAGERATRQIALHSAFLLALNRGRPRAALGILDRKRDVDPNDNLRHVFRVRGALFGDGDAEAGKASARVLEECVSGLPAAASARDSRCAPTATFMAALWRLWHDDTTGAREAIARLRRSSDGGRMLSPQAELLDALLAARIGRSDARVSLARLDSLAQLGCCGAPHFINLVSARLHERSGNLPAALAALRRGRWLFPPEFLSTYLREEGRLATLTGDRDTAVRAYRHYLELRDAPEPVLRRQRDDVQSALARLEPGG